MDSLLSIKTQRVVCLALLDESPLSYAVECFKRYTNFLSTQDTEELKQEFETANKMFIERLKEKYKKLLKDNNFKEASLYIKEILNLKSDDLDILIDYVICLHKLNEREEKEKILNLIQTNFSTTDKGTLKKLEKMYKKIEDYPNIIRCRKEIIKNKEEKWISYNDYDILATQYYFLFLKTNDLYYLEESLKALYQALDLNPTNKKLLNQLSTIEQKINEQENIMRLTNE